LEKLHTLKNAERRLRGTVKKVYGSKKSKRLPGSISQVIKHWEKQLGGGSKGVGCSTTWGGSLGNGKKEARGGEHTTKQLKKKFYYKRRDLQGDLRLSTIKGQNG